MFTARPRRNDFLSKQNMVSSSWEGVIGVKKKQVLLTVTGIAANRDEEDDAMRLTTVGTLSGRPDKWMLRYTESQPDTNEKHHITMTLGDGVVTMKRGGSYGTNMVFKKGNRFQSSYKTPYGTFDLGIFPTVVDYSVDDGGEGVVSLRYQLDIQGQYTSVHNLHIRFAANNKP